MRIRWAPAPPRAPGGLEARRHGLMDRLSAGFAGILAALVLAFGLVTTGAPQTKKGCHPDGRPVEGEVIFNSSGGTYGENVSKVYLKPFAEECGIKVSQVTDARTYIQLRELVRTGAIPWNIGGTRADEEYPLGIKDNIFHRLPDGFWDGIKADMTPGSYNEYGAWATPYADVMIYSTKAFPGGMTSWADFWDAKKFPGTRTLQNSPANLVMALIADGVPPDKVYPLDLDRAFKKMNELRPHIRFFWTSGDQPVQALLNGEVVAGTAWNGRVFPRMQQGDPIAISWNGALLRVSWNFIPKGAPHLRAAEALLYYMQRADRQAELAKLSTYTGGNRKVVELLGPALVKALATNPENVKVASLVNAQWWAENKAAAQARWDAWVATSR